MIYPEKIVETLFENSENVSNDVYIQLMNLMKRYHDFSDNEEEIVNFVNGMDTNIKNKIKKFISEEKKECTCSFNFNMCVVLLLIIFSLLILVILSYLLIRRDNSNNYFNYYNSTN